MLLKNINDWQKTAVLTPEKIREKTKIWFEYLNGS